MSRWQKQFDEHPFQKPWLELKNLTKTAKVDDDSVATDVEEIARFKKVISYLENLLESTDKELIPESTWQNFYSQCSPCLTQITYFNTNRNIQHIVQANAHADNLLNYIRPYVVESNNATQAALHGLKSYQKSVSEGLESFKNQAIEQQNIFTEIYDDFIEKKVEFENKFLTLKETNNEIEYLRKKYFEGLNNENSVEVKVEELISSIEEKHLDISKYYTELLENGSDSIMQKIAIAKDDAEYDARSINEQLHNMEKQLSYLNTFYNDVIGRKDSEGNTVGGLKNEISARQKELDEFKINQESRYTALNEQIEGLIPGATSAGLAAAYRAMRKSFSKPIKQYSILFYTSILILSVTAFISTIDSIWTSNEIIKFVDVTDIRNLASNLTHKLPIILPVLWLALFSSKRRSEAQRLQQEYAHKEALAKSYQSFKSQIEGLGGQKKEELLHKLLGAAIDAVASNASDTLDKKHGDKMPTHEGLDKTLSSLEKIKGLLK